jgi:hypothetical protein
MLRNIFLFLLISVSANYIFAQNTVLQKEIKWKALAGENNEFVFYFPEKYQSSAAGEFYSRTKSGAEIIVSSKRSFVFYKTGTIIIAEVYEGNGEKIQKYLREDIEGEATRKDVSNGYNVETFLEKGTKNFTTTQYFQTKKWVYVLKTITSLENDPVAKSFLESVRLIKLGKTVSPNAPKDATTTILTKLFDETISRDDTKIFELKEVDRKPIFISYPRPNFEELRPFLRSGVDTKYSLLLTSSGKVTDVKIAPNVQKPVERIIRDAFNDIVFVPAEKDGMLVSVWREFVFRYTSEVIVR